MTAPSSIDPTRFLHEQLDQASPDLLRQMLATFIKTLMSAEADAICGAPYGLWGSRTQAVGVDQQFQATRSYSLMSPPSTGWRLIRGRSRFGTG